MADINRYITANAMLARVFKNLGLPVPVSGSSATESNAKQMWTLITEVGQEIMDEFEWQIINMTYTISVQDPTLEYALPSDFQQFSDASGWNNTSRLPLVGPLTTQIWRLLQARDLGGNTFALQYVIEEDKVKFYWAPPDAQEVTIAYQGRGWVRDGTIATTFRDYVENDDDVIMFDPRMFLTKLLLEWKKKKGFATVDEQMAYDKALEVAKYNDRPKNDLTTSGIARYPYLGYLNIPDTRYGS